MSERRWSIGVDLGGTKIEVAYVDASGAVRDRLRMQTATDSGPDGVIGQIIEGVKDLRSKQNGSKPSALGVGIAGQVSSHDGSVRFAPNLKWTDVPLGDRLSRALRIPVAVENDVRAAALGEWLYGAGKGCEDLICMFVGTGIGGGVVSGNRMLSGCTNIAGEIGHITIDMHGPACHCNNRGCLEALASGWAIARDAREAAESDENAASGLLRRVHGNADLLTARVVTEAARDEDPLALKLMDRVADSLVAGSVGLINGFNPCRLILGGGVVEGFPQLVEKVNKGVRERALATAVASLEVVPAELHNDSGVIGAAALAMHELVGKDK